MVRARENEPFDSGQGGGVKDVGQGIEVRADQIVPRSKLVGVGRQMNDRVDPMKMRDPIVVQDLEIGDDDFRIVFGSGPIDQDQVVDIGPGACEACGRYCRRHP